MRGCYGGLGSVGTEEGRQHKRVGGFSGLNGELSGIGYKGERES